jgi:hypothetical protein
MAGDNLRSPDAVRYLEELQSAYNAEADATDVDWPNAREIRALAELEVSHEFQSRGWRRYRTPNPGWYISQIGNTKYRAAVEKRVADLTRKFQVGDGDIWSRYERLDHRSRLIDLVRRIESAIPKCGFNLLIRPVVGTLPTRDINAKAYQIPDGTGHIVAFESGMFIFTEVLARTVAESLTVRRRFGVRPLTFDKQAVIAHIGRHPGILHGFSDLIFTQISLGTCQYTNKLFLPIGFRLNETYDPLRDSVDTFVLAHEYGHVILGHPAAEEPVSDAERVQQEFEADEVALQLTLAAFDDPKWAYGGAVLFLTAVAVLDLAAAVLQNGRGIVLNAPSHPSPPQRLSKLAANLQKFVRPVARQAADELGQMIKWLFMDLWEWLQPAFEVAHRDGFTQRLPVRVYTEKDALLHTFLGVAFGLDFAKWRGRIEETMPLSERQLLHEGQFSAAVPHRLGRDGKIAFTLPDGRVVVPGQSDKAGNPSLKSVGELSRLLREELSRLLATSYLRKQHLQ